MFFTSIIENEQDNTNIHDTVLEVLVNAGKEALWLTNKPKIRPTTVQIAEYAVGECYCKIMVYNWVIPVAILEQKGKLVLDDSVVDMQEHNLSDQKRDIGSKIPCMIAYTLVGENHWLYSEAVLGKHTEQSSYEDAIESKITELVQLLPAPEEITAPEALEEAKADQAPEEAKADPNDNAVEQRNLEQFKGDAQKDVYDADDWTDFPAALEARKEESFLTKIPSFTLEEHLLAVRKEVTPEQWRTVGEITKCFLGIDGSMNADKSRLLYTLNFKYYIGSLLTGDATGFWNAYKLANSSATTGKPKLIDKMKELDTVSSRLAQSHDHRGVFMRFGPRIRKGEFCMFVNLYDKKRSLVFTATKFTPVAQAICNEQATQFVMDYISEKAKSRLVEVPKTEWLTGAMNESDLDLLSDLISIADSKNPGTFGIGYGIQGGNLFSATKEKEERFMLDPFAYITALGLPFIYYCKNAYRYDENFRRYWDETLCERLRSRQSLHKDEVGELIREAEELFSLYKLRNGKPVMEDITWDNVTNNNTYHALLNEYQVALRATVCMELVELGVFVGQRFVASVLPNDAFLIMQINDLYMNGMDVEVVDALGYLNVGHLVGKTCTKTRMPMQKDDRKVDVTDQDRLRYDTSSGNAGKALLDFSLHVGGNGRPLVAYVGAGSILTKFTKRPDNETRTGIYFDLERKEEERFVRDGTVLHHPENPEENPQWTLNMSQFSRLRLGKEDPKHLDVLACLVQMRAMPKILELYGKHICVVAPAPYPAASCLYVLATRTPPTKPVTIKHCYRVIAYQLSSYFYATMVYTYGYNGVTKLFKLRNRVMYRQDGLATVFSVWYQQMVKRFAWEREEERQGSADWYVKPDPSRLLRTDTSLVKKNAIITNGENMRKGMQMSFGTRRPKRDLA